MTDQIQWWIFYVEKLLVKIVHSDQVDTHFWSRCYPKSGLWDRYLWVPGPQKTFQKNRRGMAFPGNGKNHSKLRFFWHFVLKNLTIIKILDIFGILSSRRFQWCALLVHCSKKIFCPNFRLLPKFWDLKYERLIFSSYIPLMHIIGSVLMRQFQKYPIFGFLVNFRPCHGKKTLQNMAFKAIFGVTFLGRPNRGDFIETFFGVLGPIGIDPTNQNFCIVSFDNHV